MARLVVKLRGKPVQEIKLQAGRSYTVGRREDCDIVLEPEKGISREHFKLVDNGTLWSVEVTSRYGEVYLAGEKIESATLAHGAIFTVSPYEFEFFEGGDLSTNSALSESFHPPQVSVGVDDHLPVNPMAPAPDFDGKTFVGAAPSIPYVKIVDSYNEPKELFRLEGGESWTAGRDHTCQIVIRDQRVSRRQFEIRKMGSSYYIIDLGSVNGTLLNGNPVSTTEPVPLRSGDSISVLENFLFFELRDPQFENRLQLVQAQPLSPLVPHSHELVPHEATLPVQAYPGSPSVPVGHVSYSGAPQPTGLGAKIKGFDFEKNRPKVIIGAVVFLTLLYLLFGGDSSQSPNPNTANQGLPGSPAQEAFKKLPPEQQTLVKQTYQLAKSLYMQGKYQLAQNEMVKIFEYVPDYEDAQEIVRLAGEGVERIEAKRRQEEIEKARAEAEAKIIAKADECKKLINSEVTMDAMDSCIAPVLEFNPEHPRLMELKSEVERITADRQAKEAQAADYRNRVAQLKGIYSRAEDTAAKAPPLDAIEAYQKVIASSLPDPQGLKAKARAKIAGLKSGMNQKTASLQTEATKYYQNQNLKAAILTLRKAKRIDPENPDIADRIESYTLELRKQMMALYQEGVLEESFGNVDGGESRQGAKDKWKKILELDIPDGEYYKKAYIKLKKYGAL